MLASVLGLLAVASVPATAATFSGRGQLLHLARPGVLATNQSSNWFGYNQGSLEKKKLFHSIVGVWTVPTATQHQSGQAEYAADWIGIGGGCVNVKCTVTDSTLIQTGTEEDVSSSGSPAYSAWYELVPAPSINISMSVKPGDEMAAEIAETVPNSDVWKITLIDVTQNESFTKTVPYTSTHATAEWIEETPLIIGTGAGFAALPNLTTVEFSHAMVNGANADLSPSEEMELVSSGQVIGTPSAPASDLDAFNACAWATSCSAPAS